MTLTRTELADGLDLRVKIWRRKDAEKDEYVGFYCAGYAVFDADAAAALRSADAEIEAAMRDRVKLDGLLQRVEKALAMHLPREPGLYTRSQEMTIAAWSEVKTYREQLAKAAPDA